MIDYGKEDLRYSELYKLGYGSGPVGLLLKWVLDSGVQLKQKTIVDCGCGNAALLTRGIEFFQYVGIDLASYQIEKLNQSTLMKKNNTEFIHGSIDSIPFKDQSYDIAWCCDVLEHIDEASIDKVLKEISRVASLVILSVCTRASVILDSQGNNLHLTVKNEEWWRKKISKVGKILHETALCGNNISVIVEC
ncbi:class I SAM-dependent methyltransferase [Gimesia fumaroli]|uniref:Bifunctional 3-demethylubiquinone-9 3-methyltransferase/ 2-octaprenyl-6-hydroxy phenol methylase n=1 Tax=Gimesia fumaroli TaxID=2527976 RepID=A0A518IGG4_9PLAN|nr:class I SAM-dependent methyltransferase [Gimesia fumaroli]QDV52172.1 bifunctional 3-demethylubiquinone-9 3-methyltransferase/ 2-octaprenyl-6-hydroxy phenol methylase [Gimesia fumaroli]